MITFRTTSRFLSWIVLWLAVVISFVIHSDLGLVIVGIVWLTSCVACVVFSSGHRTLAIALVVLSGLPAYRLERSLLVALTCLTGGMPVDFGRILAEHLR
jgi:hypothetical protein